MYPIFPETYSSISPTFSDRLESAVSVADLMFTGVSVPRSRAALWLVGDLAFSFLLLRGLGLRPRCGRFLFKVYLLGLNILNEPHHVWLHPGDGVRGEVVCVAKSLDQKPNGLADILAGLVEMPRGFDE